MWIILQLHRRTIRTVRKQSDKRLSEKMATMKTSIKSIKTITPSLTQTSHPQTFKLSALDELCPDVHFNVTFFYLNPNSSSSNFDHTSHFFQISQHLQDSLSETLNLFYPIAGRYHDNSTIDCNDEGVVFIESETHYHLSEILASPDHDTIEHQFLPSSYPEVKENSIHGRPLMLMNFILFLCGGIGLSISVSHKIFDLASLMTFLNSWTATCSGSKEAVVPDLTIASSLLPPRELANSPNNDPPSTVDKAFMKYTMRRLIFSPSKITELKNKVLSEIRHAGHENGYPSRVDVVLSLVCKSIISSLKSVRGSFRPMLVGHATNLRTRMDPLLSKYSIGNMAWAFSVAVQEEEEVELNELIRKMMAFKKSLTEKSTKIKGEGFEEALKEVQGMFSNSKNDLLLCSSWCNFEMFGVDFGMGSPVWMTSVSQFLAAKFVQVLDTKEVGGVEALVFLEEEVVNAFESNEELLQFAIFKTNVI